MQTYQNFQDSGNQFGHGAFSHRHSHTSPQQGLNLRRHFNLRVQSPLIKEKKNNKMSLDQQLAPIFQIVFFSTCVWVMSLSALSDLVLVLLGQMLRPSIFFSLSTNYFLINILFFGPALISTIQFIQTSFRAQAIILPDQKEVTPAYLVANLVSISAALILAINFANHIVFFNWKTLFSLFYTPLGINSQDRTEVDLYWDLITLGTLSGFIYLGNMIAHNQSVLTFSLIQVIPLSSLCEKIHMRKGLNSSTKRPEFIYEKALIYVRKGLYLCTKGLYLDVQNDLIHTSLLLEMIILNFLFFGEFVKQKKRWWRLKEQMSVMFFRSFRYGLIAGLMYPFLRVFLFGFSWSMLNILLYFLCAFYVSWQLQVVIHVIQIFNTEHVSLHFPEGDYISEGLAHKNAYIKYLAYVDFYHLAQFSRLRRSYIYNDESGQIWGSILQSCCSVIDEITITDFNTKYAKSRDQKGQLVALLSRFTPSKPSTVPTMLRILSVRALTLIVTFSLSEDPIGTIQNCNSIPIVLSAFLGAEATLKSKCQEKSPDRVDYPVWVVLKGSIYSIVTAFYETLSYYPFPSKYLLSLQRFVDFQE